MADIRIDRIINALPNLSLAQLKSIDSLVDQFKRPYIKIEKNDQSDIINDGILVDFGDMIRLHHCFSKSGFTKDKFEYAFTEVMNLAGRKAELAPANNKNFDLICDGQRFSLKSQADSKIKKDSIHISKFMELGSSKLGWGPNIEDLYTLRDLFLSRLDLCDRIITLRVLERDPFKYELVEIPKMVLEKVKGGIFRHAGGKSNPPSGYCEVIEEGEHLFRLYFDGGGEMKLQVQNLLKKYCIVHAEWHFNAAQVIPDQEE